MALFIILVGLKVADFLIKKSVTVSNSDQCVQSIVAAKVYSQCLWCLEYITLPYKSNLKSHLIFSRNLASSIKKPFELRYNPYTQTVQTLSSGGKILDIAKQIKGDVFLIANAIKKIQGNENENDSDVDFDQICQFLDVQKM